MPPKKGHLTLRATLKGEDDLTRPWSKALDKAERKAGRTFGRIERMGMRVRRGMTRIGVGFNKGMDMAGRGVKRGVSALGTLTKVSAGVTGAAALAVDQFGKFELQVARLGNLLPDNVDAVAEYEQILRNLSVATGTDAIETANAAYMAFSGGVDTSKDALNAFLPIALKASKAGFTEPAVAVDALTSVLNTYKDSALTAADVSDKLFVTEALGKTDFGQIANGIGGVAAFAKEMGLTFDEILAPTAALTKTGLTTSAAFTQLESLIAGLASPTAAAAKEFKKLKQADLIGAGSIKRLGGIEAVLQRLQGIIAKEGAGVIPKLFGRKEAQKAAFALAGGGLKDVQETLAALSNAAGTTENKFANLERRTGFKIQQLKTGFKLLVTELGGGIAEGLGLDKLQSIPGGVESAGKKLRSGARAFAEGFIQALAPGQSLADLDWKGIARDAGQGFGNFVTTLGKLASVLSDIVKGVGEFVGFVSDIDGFIGGNDKIQKKLDKQGVKAFERDTTDFTDRLVGSAAGAAPQAQGRTKDLVRRLESGELELKSELIDPALFAVEMAKRNAMVLKQQEDKSAQKRRRLSVANNLSQAAGPGAGQPGTAQVGGEVKVKVEVEGAGVKSTEVEASSKNPKVPVRADVGKRKAASE